MRADQDARIRKGEDVAREGEILHSTSNKCYRCNRDITVAHSRDGFCPAFGQPSEAGRWLFFSDIRRVLAEHARGAISVQESNRVEEPEGPYGVYHRIVGIAHNGKFAGRFDYPYVPEFSIWHSGNDEYGLPTSSINSMLYSGWRRNLRQVCDKAEADWWEVTRDLGISPDRSTEHGLRWMAGRL